MAANKAHLRSLYRRFLRELPARQPSLLANPSPVQQRIRQGFSTSAVGQEETQHDAAERAEQLITFLKSQRLYTTLVERYNPGMNMSDEERVRLSARRVGMNMPPDWYPGKKDN